MRPEFLKSPAPIPGPERQVQLGNDLACLAHRRQRAREEFAGTYGPSSRSTDEGDLGIAGYGRPHAACTGGSEMGGYRRFRAMASASTPVAPTAGRPVATTTPNGRVGCCEGPCGDHLARCPASNSIARWRSRSPRRGPRPPAAPSPPQTLQS
jgi:hypothetical protein